MRPFKAEILLVESGPTRLLIKDFSNHRWWSRAWGRYEIHRELRAYRQLADLAVLPPCFGLLDADALVLGWIDGTELIEYPRRFEDAERILAELECASQAFHDRGVVHLDLGGRHNVMIDSAGRVRVIDLAGSWRCRPRRFAFRFLLPWVRRVDRAALLKWKKLLLIPLTKDEWRRSARRAQVRPWWWLNRKVRAGF